MNILVTGSTGFIGKRLIRKLAGSGHRLYLLVRPASRKKAEDMFKDISDVRFIEGDVEETDILKNTTTIGTVLEEIESVVHLAAFYDLTASHAEAYMKNVIGTQNVLQLLTRMKNVTHFHYFSTYAVNPVAQGAVNEDFLVKDDLPFFDLYSKTKNQAEHLVRQFKKDGLSIVIHRPGVIIGDSETGEMEKADGPYYLYDFIQKIKKLDIFNSKIPFLPLPIRANSNLPVLPVNILADWCGKIISSPAKHDLRCYHLVPEPMIKTKDFLQESLEFLDFPVKILPLSQTKLVAPFLPLLNIPSEAAFYMNQQTVFDRSHLKTDFPQLESPHYQQYLKTIIDGFLRSKA